MMNSDSPDNPFVASLKERIAQLEAEKAKWGVFSEQVFLYRSMTIGELSEDAQWIIERMIDALKESNND